MSVTRVSNARVRLLLPEPVAREVAEARSYVHERFGPDSDDPAEPDWLAREVARLGADYAAGREPHAGALLVAFTELLVRVT